MVGSCKVLQDSLKIVSSLGGARDGDFFKDWQSIYHNIYFSGNEVITVTLSLHTTHLRPSIAPCTKVPHISLRENLGVTVAKASKTHCSHPKALEGWSVGSTWKVSCSRRCIPWCNPPKKTNEGLLIRSHCKT